MKIRKVFTVGAQSVTPLSVGEFIVDILNAYPYMTITLEVIPGKIDVDVIVKGED